MEFDTIKKNSIILLTAMVLAAGLPARQLSNANKQGIYVRSIESALRLREDQIDLGIATLIISEQWSDDVLGRHYQRRLDEMANEILDLLEQKNSPINYHAIAVINDYLYNRMNFTTVKEADDPYDLFLHSVMDRRRGYCLSLSVLYLAMAERIGLPLYGVVVPGHFFVRYDDGTVRFNIETTNKGGTAPDSHYIDEFNVPQDRDTVYLKNLNKRQVLGCFFNNLGNSYIQVDNIPQAQISLEWAVDINPTLAESHTNLGNVYMRLERFNDALNEYHRAVSILPEEPKVRNNLGTVYLQKKRLQPAIEHFQIAIDHDPNFIDAYKNLARAYTQKQFYTKATITLQKALRIEPQNASLWYEMGNIHLDQQYAEKAIGFFQNAVAYDRHFPEAYFSLGLCYNLQDNSGKEIESYHKALAIKPDLVAARVNLGNAYFRLKSYEEAIRQYKQALTEQPEDATIAYNIGAAYSNLGSHETALQWYLDAVEYDPGMPDAHNGLAGVYYHQEEYRKAFEHLKRARELGADIDETLWSTLQKKNQ